MSINVKGIILAGGMGKRMRPLSNIFSKHLMSVYDKPMIFYSLSVLIYSGVKNILLIFTKIISIRNTDRKGFISYSSIS